MDVLSEVLSSLSIQSTLSCSAELTAPWGLRFDPNSERAGFFLVVRGSAYLEMDKDQYLGPEAEFLQKPISLRGGDMVLLPRGNGYTIKDEIDSPSTKIQELMPCSAHDSYETLRFGGGGGLTVVIAGCFLYAQGRNNPLISGLPPLIHIKAEEGRTDPWLETTIRFIASEALHAEQGSSMIISRLSDIIFAQAMRHFTSQIKNCPKSTGWLKALSDPQMSRAIGLMHTQPEAPWTVAELAQQVGISRSAFAEKFTDVTGVSPLQYLTDWRMHRARQLMADKSLNLSEIALKVGYQSEAAFSKAFKRELGIAPGGFRTSLAGVN